MGAIPDRHFRPALLHGEPVSHHAAAGRPSHPVKPPDQEVQHRHDHDGSRACPEQLDRHGHEHHGQGRQYQPQGKEHPRVATIRNAPHQELRQGVGHRVQRQHDTQRSLVEPVRSGGVC